jgi:hypothetical protein
MPVKLHQPIVRSGRHLVSCLVQQAAPQPNRALERPTNSVANTSGSSPSITVLAERLAYRFNSTTGQELLHDQYLKILYNQNIETMP